VQPTEEQLRHAKADLLERVSDQQRVLGVPDPGGKVVEDFVTPIIERVARGPQTREPAPKQEPQRDPELTYEHMGDYQWRQGDLAPTPIGTPKWTATPEDRLRSFIRYLFRHPAEGAELKRITKMCEKHTNPKVGCNQCQTREDLFKKNLRRCAVKYGYGTPVNHNPWRTA
jgi:hypothetical protein